MPANSLVGLSLEGGWKVVDKITNRDGTGGCFSIGYLVEQEDGSGKQAFLKAMDFSSVFNEPDWIDKLKPLVDSYHFERNLYEKCKDKKVKRVVTPLLAGEVKVTGFAPPMDKVLYIIFEKAIGSLRSPDINAFNEELAWKLRMLHNAALGVRQLHGAQIAHQDLKMSNVLVFDEDRWSHKTSAKITDLGRSTDNEQTSANDSLVFAGDTQYTPIDRLYHGAAQQDFQERRATDLYLLGSLIFIFFNNTPIKTELMTKLREPKYSSYLTSNFIADLPYLTNAFESVLEEFAVNILPECKGLTEEIVLLVKKLCQPNPLERGERSGGKSLSRQYDLQWVVSALDRLATHAEIGKV